MSLRLPEEIVAEQFVPTARTMLARELDERGLTQQAIADRLGITQAAVSNHLNGQVDVAAPIADDPRMAATVEEIADGFAEGSMDEVDALGELVALVQAFEDRGPICELHEQAMPALEGLGCDLCVRGRDEAVQAERDALAAVREASRRLGASQEMVTMVPNVGTNVATAIPGATEPTDVAAVPGRLIRMRGRIEVPANPEFGASRNVATAILAATTVDPEMRGAINLALDEDLLAAARERGIDPIEFDPEYENRRERLVSLFEERGSVPRLCYHRGAFGVEPVCYVFGETAVEAVDLAIELRNAVAGQTG
ncbi:HTH DNA-binding protein [Salinarchaeum sp. Harcht-Bsk1]|uniref:thiamine-phosphate synthase family protein n=1 Tax=Salinarchaeum sp. Harcht-Bsk1 TaxID=1333523 RepID=UPI00034240B7|nr:thiamine-phosphate synthase family protein [Salinarchaeum sp. Harcht-Bsk1]AGN00375.1 HTH DNA-binding protein [Salinarchaeum sp. Harcht-Bsk1]